MYETNRTINDAGIGGLFDFNFTRFVTKSVIKGLYILIFALIALVVLGVVVAGFSDGVGSGLILLVLAPLVGLVYLLFARVGLEVIIVLFRIADYTAKLAGEPPVGQLPGRGFEVVTPAPPPSVTPPTPPSVP